MNPAEHPGTKTVPHKKTITIVILLAMFMAVLDCMIVSIALPTITAFYNADIAVSQWTMTGYLVTMTAAMLIFARLSEKYGKNRLFLAGMALFTASSLGCALAPILPVLIALRCVQGLGAAMSVSVLMAILFDIHRFEEHGKAMGILGATVALASVSGPVLGGFLVEFTGWQSIFFINIPVGMLLLVLGVFSMDLTAPQCNELFVMDISGAGSLVIAVVSFMLAVGFAAGGTLSFPVIACAGVCLGALAVFIRTEQRHKHPLLDLGIVTHGSFIIPLLGMCFLFTAVVILYVSVPLFFEGVMAYTPSQVGILFLLVAAILTIGSPLVGRAYDRTTWKHYTPAGLLIAAGGFFLFAATCSFRDPVVLAVALIITAIGFAFAQSPVNTEIMRGLPAKKSAVASGLNSAGRHFAMALGASLAALIYALYLHGADYYGVVTKAGPDLITGATMIAFTTAGVFCAVGVILYLFKERKPGIRRYGGIIEFVILIVTPLLLHTIVPVMIIIAPPFTYAGLGILSAGFALMIWSAREFRKTGTGFRLQDGRSILVSTGPFRFSRNPMYLGILIWLFGYAVILGSLGVFILPALFFVLAHSILIPIEEKRMEQLFREQYIGYQKQVGRWL